MYPAPCINHMTRYQSSASISMSVALPDHFISASAETVPIPSECLLGVCSISVESAQSLSSSAPRDTKSSAPRDTNIGPVAPRRRGAADAAATVGVDQLLEQLAEGCDGSCQRRSADLCKRNCVLVGHAIPESNTCSSDQ